MKSIVSEFNEKEWQAQRDLDTLLESKKICDDPKRMKAARAQAVKRKQELMTEIGNIAIVQADGDADGDKD